MRFLIIYLLGIVLIASCSKSKNSIHATEKPILEAVYASGYIEAKNQYTIYAQKNGVIAKQVVADGGTFKANDIILILDDGLTQPRKQATLKAYEVASQNSSTQSPILNELESKLSMVKSKLSFDSTNYQRYQSLYRQKACSQIDVDKAKLSYDNSKREYVQALENKKQVQNKVELDLKNTKSQLELLQSEFNFLNIKAPYNGILYKTFKYEGELVRAGEPLAIIGKADNYYCKLKIDEQDIGRVQLGQEVIIKADAFENQNFNAKIAHIYPQVDPRDQSVRVDAELISSLPIHFTGLAIEANIIIRSAEKALVIPKNYLIGKDSLQIKDDDGKHFIQIETGIQTLDEVEIKSGIDANTEIIIP
jgi:HlyD family secretion protein